jgi:Family of unknown function (DUF6152)
MKGTIVAVAALVVGAASGAALAHHSFAMFDASQHKLIEGTVMEWNYNNPHSWLLVEAPGPDGQMTTWSFEGAAIVHAARQGVNGKSYAKGERVRVVMHPLRDGRNAGALCFVIKEDGTLTRPNDGICNSDAMYARWQEKGWLESSHHLDTHPTAD